MQQIASWVCSDLTAFDGFYQSVVNETITKHFLDKRPRGLDDDALNHVYS